MFNLNAKIQDALRWFDFGALDCVVLTIGFQGIEPGDMTAWLSSHPEHGIQRTT